MGHTNGRKIVKDFQKHLTTKFVFEVLKT